MKRWLKIALPAGLLVGCLLLISVLSPLVRADYNANNIIDDYVFDNTGSMSVAGINDFLNAFSSSCISTNHGFTAPDPVGYSPSAGYSYGGYVSAGQVIYDAAQAYHLNPQVILTTLQKEQSLVTGTAGCNTLRYVGAVGYGCPDGGTTYDYSGQNFYAINGQVTGSVSGTCVNGAAKAGFSQQVIRGAWLLKFGQQRSRGNVGWAEIHGSWNNSDDPAACYGGPMTQGDRKRCSSDSNTIYYDGYITIDGSATHMDTGATAALYWYTPHFSGNQHFSAIFESWFGATRGDGFTRVISDNSSDTRQWVIYNGVKQLIPDIPTLNAWSLQNATLTTMPAVQLNAITTGPSLDRLMVLKGATTVYFMDGGQRHRVPWNNILDTWNLRGRTISTVSAGLFSQPAPGSDLSYALKGPGSATIYMPDGANGGGQTVLRPFANIDVLGAWEGSTANYTDVSSDFFDTIDNAIGSSLTSTKVVSGGADYQIFNGYRLWQTTAVSAIYPGTAQPVSWATIGRMSVGPNVTQVVRSPQSSIIFLIDNGIKYPLANNFVLNAWITPTQDITTVNNNYLNLFVTGTTINGYLADNGGQLYVMNQRKLPVPTTLDTAYRSSGSVFSASAGLLNLYPTSSPVSSLVVSNTAPTVYLLDNSGKRRPLNSTKQIQAWNGSQPVTVLSFYVIDALMSAPVPSLYVSDGTTNYLVDGAQKWSVNNSVASDWGLSSPQTYTDGTLNRLPSAGILANKVRDQSGAYFLIRGGTGYATTDANIANEWAINTAPQMTPQAVTNQMTVYMLTRFVRSSVAGDPRLFVIDNGNWYTVNPTQYVNLGGTNNQPVMYFDPQYAPNTITAWASVVVKDGNGTAYVLDGGTKRLFVSTNAYNQWTNSNSLSQPTVSNGFLNLLPASASITQSVKGGGPAVFGVINGVKRHVISNETYSQQYAPYSNVSEALINSLPDGADIN